MAIEIEIPLEPQEQAHRLMHAVRKAVVRILGTGMDSDAVASAMISAGIELAVSNDSAENVQQWLHEVADAIPEKLAQHRPLN